MKQILLMMAAVVLVGCGTTKIDPNAPANISDPLVEKAVRGELKKPQGELTNADIEKVTSLFLNDTKITDAGLKDVAKLQQLTTLFLHGTKITDAGLKEVAKLQKLEMLWLRDTKITDEGLKDVAKLQKLTFLDLSNTKITKADVAELKKAMPNCKIEGP